MNITRILTAMLAGGMLFTGCSKENDFDEKKQKDKVAYATIVLEEGTIPVKSGTKATEAGNDAERHITQLELYIFDENGERDSQNDGYANFTGDDASGFSKVVAVTAGDIQVLVAANMKLGKLGTANLEAVKKTITNVSVGTLALPGTKPYEVPADGIPMAGESNGIQKVEEGTATSEIKVKISRLYSRINTPFTTSSTEVNITDTEELDKLDKLGLDTNTTITFAFDGFVVINGINHSYVISDITNWTLGMGMNHVNSVYNDTDGSITSVYSGKKTNDFFYSDSEKDYIYVYENVPQTKKNSGNIEVLDSKTVYALLIRGELKDGNNKAVTRYWRVNLAKDWDYTIFRNGYYNTEIQKITSAGYDTPEDAEEDDNKEIPVPGETGIVAKITIADWQIYSGQTDL